MKRMDDEIARIDAGGTAVRPGDEIVELTVKRPLDKVIPVRLSDDDWRALHREASDLGIGPTTLARMWILERLKSTHTKKKTA